MSEPRKPGFVLPVAVTLAVLLGLYVGAYYATVVPEKDVEFVPVQVYDFYPALGFRFHWEWHRFFAAINWLDRRIRPHVWEPTP